MKVAEAGEPGVPADGSEDDKPNFANSRGTWGHGLKKCSLPAAEGRLQLAFISVFYSVFLSSFAVKRRCL